MVFRAEFSANQSESDRTWTGHQTGSFKQSLRKGLLIKRGLGTEKSLRIVAWATSSWAPLPASRLGGLKEGEVTQRERALGHILMAGTKTLVEGRSGPGDCRERPGESVPQPLSPPLPLSPAGSPTSQPNRKQERKRAHRRSLLGTQNRVEKKGSGSGKTSSIQSLNLGQQECICILLFVKFTHIFLNKSVLN